MPVIEQKQISSEFCQTKQKNKLMREEEMQ